MTPGAPKSKYFIFVLLIVIAAFMYRVVLLGKVLLPLDMVFTEEPWKSELPDPTGTPKWNPEVTDAIWQFYPIAVYAQEVWRQGIPLWDPNVLSGIPSLARGEMFSNPLFTLLALFLPAARALSLATVLHLMLGGLFMWLLIREMGTGPFGALIGALTFILNGYLVVWMSFPPLIGSMVWLPVIAWGIECAIRREDWRWILLSALGFALQLYSGNILWVVYSSITLSILSAYRLIISYWQERDGKKALRPVIYTVAALLIGGGLAASQLAMSGQLFFNTNRTTAIGANSFLSLLTHPIRLLAPDVYGTPLNGDQYRGFANFTETNIYFGVLPLFFLVASIFSRMRKLAWGLVGLGLICLLAVYNVFPFRQIVAGVYPVFLNTFPGRIFYVIAFVWSLAIGLGADWLIIVRQSRITKWLIFLSIILASGLSILMGLVLYIRANRKIIILFSKYFTKALAKMEWDSILNAILLLIASCLLLWILAKTRVNRYIVVCFMVGFVVLDLLSAGINYNPAFDPKLAFPSTASIDYLQTIDKLDREPHRILNIQANNLILAGMAPELFGFQTISGYSSWVLGRYYQYVKLALGRNPVTINHMYFDDCCNNLIDALNVKYVYAANGAMPSSLTTNAFTPTLKLIYDGPNKIYENLNVFPRAWVVHRVIEVGEGNLEAVNQFLAKPDVNLADAAVIEGSLPGELGAPSADDNVHISSYANDRVEIDTNIHEPGLLILADVMYPGWEASIDGAEQEIYFTNLIMRGVYLPRGEHRLIFTYKLTGSRIWAWMTSAPWVSR